MEVADPYEQHLLSVFESCDDYYQGSLSAAGLHQLCEKLEILDQYGKLTQKLIGDFKSKRVFFHEFKEGLLKLLSGIDCDEKSDGKLSPGKEVPKNHALNKNQYRRNLRLQNNEYDGLSSDDLSDTQHDQSLSCSTDDVNSEESVPKRRRTRGSKRRERKSFEKPGKNESLPERQQTAPPASATNEVEHLIAAWSSISRGVTDSLRRDELVKVFQCVGLERGSEEAAECVFEKLGLDESGGITLQELLEFIRSGGSWNKGNRSQNMEAEAGQKGVSMEYTEPSILGCVTIACLVEQLESAGVPGAHQLFKSLGFQPSQQIDLSSLVPMLSEEIKSMSDEMKSTRSDSHMALLKANLVLQNLYIQNLKSTIEHVNAEKEKLRNDVFDANQRALLLAQEVDDHHSKLEHSTQQQVRVMEQKHADKIRELTNQAKAEQDALMSQNMALERRLKVLEQEENRNKLLITQLEMEGRTLEQEHRAVMDQLAAVQATKEKLEEDLENVSALQQRVSEMESSMKENDVVSLLERIRTLEFENTSLRDRNDELSVEVEELSTKLLNTSIKKRSNSSNPISMDQSMEESISGVAMKRRGDSFVMTDSAEDSGGEEGSPRLGKVRKCSHVKDFAETTTCLKELQIHGGNRGESIEDDSSNNEADTEDAGGGGGGGRNGNSFKITPFSEELEQAGGKVDKTIWSEEVEKNLQKIEGRLKKCDQGLAREVMKAFREILKDQKDKSEASGDDKLKTRCQELESSLELLREEYEKTEDYWSEKLEDERAFFEEEQKLSDKKYSELLEKILEYEELLNAEREQRQRLETIEEKDSFERQVADMEQECSELKSKLAETIREKEMELEKLKSEISSLKLSRDCIDSGVQVSDVDSYDTQILSGGEGSDKWKTPSRRSSSKHLSCRQCGEIKNLIEMKLKYQREVEMMREERDRLLREINERRQKLSGYSRTIPGSERIYDLERKCHTLMVTLRQQQKQTEDILKNTWKQHKAEVKDLKSVLKMTEEKLKRQTKVIQEQLAKLAKTDLLVKDLFVENAYLVSSVQKLEQKCQSVDGSTKTGS